MRHANFASRFRATGGSDRRQVRKRAEFRSQLLQLEERCLMSRGVPIPEAQLKNPTLNVPLAEIFWNGGPPIDDEGVPGVTSPEAADAMKTITLTNYSKEFIYPFLRTENDGKALGKYYDPQDLHQKEFREYVGYSVGSGSRAQYFLGLPPGATIKFQVPLVLWDGNHITLATDGKDLTATKEPVSTLFGYTDNAKISIAQTAPVSGSVWVQGSAHYPRGFNPLIMFYYAGTPAAVGNDAPAQLVEITFRDPLLKNFITDASQTFPEASYDVSYVNTLHAPAALEASKVPITTGSLEAKPKPNLTYYRPNEDWGWNGSNQGTETFDPLVRAFVNNTRGSRASIGDYFGGKGWPRYYNPDANNFVIPSGANVFDDSPLDTRNPPQIVHTSHYSGNRWLLSSSGDGAIMASAGGLAVKEARPKQLSLLFTGPAQKRAFAEDIASMRKSGQPIYVTAKTATKTYANVGTLVGYQPTEGGGTASVRITQPLPTDVPFSFVFQRTATDYASTAITNLWYSWAQYYVNSYARKYPNFQPETAQGSLVYGKIGLDGPFLTNQIKFQSLPPVLAVGMTVTAPKGLPNGATVLKIVGNTVYLSQIPSADTPTNQQYTFGLPTAKALPTSPFTTPYTLSFDTARLPKNPPTPDPLLFAGAVYEAMAVEATAPMPKPPNNYLPGTMYVVDNVIKFNANIPTNYENSWSKTVVAEVRDIVKSILRGVVDYVADPNQNHWYPDPAKKVPGTFIAANGVPRQAQFNVFNLDPYVWFVHKVQGLSGYGFSVDDDVSNPIAPGPDDPEGNPTNDPKDLQVGFAGIKGVGNQKDATPFGNQKEWFPTTKFGSITTMATIGYETGNPKYDGSPIITLVPTKEDPDPLRTLNQITVPGEGQLGATITAPNNPGFFAPGTTLTFFPDGVDVPEKPNILLSKNPLKTTSKAILVKIDAAP